MRALVAAKGTAQGFHRVNNDFGERADAGATPSEVSCENDAVISAELVVPVSAVHGSSPPAVSVCESLERILGLCSPDR